MSITSGHKWSPKIILGAGILGLSLQALANPAAPPKAAAAAPVAVSAFDMSKVPLVTPMPRPGVSITPPSGPGYYSLWDLVTGNERKAPPVAPYAPFGLLPTSSFDIDFRYLAKPGYEKDLFDPLKRIQLGNDWLVSFGGNFWYRHVHESDSRLATATANNTDNTFNLVRTRLHADIWYQDKFRLFAEGIDARSFSQTLPPLAIDVNHTDMLNLFADIKLATAKEGVAYVRVGRQELLYGSQRLISTLDWANTRRTFQGVKTFWRNPKLDVDAFWMRPMNVVPSGPQNFDNWDTNRNFYGLWATYKPQRGHFADLYFLSLDNNNSTISGKSIGTLNSGSNSLVHTVGTRYIGDTNNFLYELEGMYQFGQRSGRDISAFAVASGAGYRFATLPMNPQTWLRYDFASGTNNGGDVTNTSNTFNQLFPFGHYYMGFLDRVGRQNIHDLNAQMTLHPQQWLTVIAQYHRFYLANKTDALYNAAGFASVQDLTGQSGNHVGDEMDVRFNIHVNRHQDVLLGYSKLWAGEYLKATKPGVSPDLFYVQYSFRF
ncbi:MAG: alginate export family protein [Nitrosomonadaceae bacterium]